MLKQSRRNFLFGTAALAVSAGLLASCGGGGGGVGGGGSNTGTLRVSLVDAPDPTITSLNVTITRVEAHIAGSDDNSGWTTLTAVPQPFDLLDLVDNEAILSSVNLPVGHYTQIRLFIDPNTATVTDSTGTHPVNIPSAAQTGIKLNVDFDVTANQITTILLDFNVSKSLRKLGNGNYQLQPVIPVVIKVLSGTVTGVVTFGGNPVVGADVKAVYTAGSSYPLGTEVNTTFTLAPDGRFKIWALLPGTYTITASTTNPARTASKTGIVVTANQNTNAGTFVLQ